ncbi:4-hydroxyphenylpyruvate dioxygenase [Pyxidicoccus sp. 3LG]
MVFKDIDHVGMFVENARQAALFYVGTFGFRVVGQAGAGLGGQRSFLLQQGHLRLVLTEAAGEGEAADFVARHGDAVRDIALRVSEVEVAFREAVQRGARPVSGPEAYGEGEGRVARAVVGAMGDVVHSFIQRESRGGAMDFLPGVFHPVTEDFPLPAFEPFASLDHLALALEPGTLEPMVRFYRDVFGFHESHEENVRTGESGMNSKVVQNDNGRICFPMMEPARGGKPGQIDDFLARHGGPGVQHFAMLSHDIEAAIRALKARQVEFLEIPGSYYEVLEERLGKLDLDVARTRDSGILVDRDAWGLLLQAFTRSMHPRRTLFFEVIQRKDARGFGGANIRALFEAVEREQARRP